MYYYNRSKQQVKVASEGHHHAIYSIWHDPSTYDHMAMGPPYLPGSDAVKSVGQSKEASSGVPDSKSLSEIRGLVSKVASENKDFFRRFLSSGEYDFLGLEGNELSILLAYLRAIGFIHQTHHWQVQGESSYGDHLLFERIYNDTLAMIDSLAERAVGVGDPSKVNPVIQATLHCDAIKDLYNGEPMGNMMARGCVLVSLHGVLKFMALLGVVYDKMKSSGTLTPGIDNLLQGIGDKHEEFVYLLRQRSAVKVASVMKLGPGEEHQKNTEILRKSVLKAKNRGDIQSATLSAGFYAKKLNRPMYVYAGNSYGHGVWRVTYKMSEVLSFIDNTGNIVIEVTPDLKVIFHRVVRPISQSEDEGT